MAELKRCPFCKGEAEIRGVSIGDCFDGYTVYCNDCAVDIGFFDTKEKAIKIWNTRPSNWHTGTPQEEGWYLVAYRKRDCDGSYFWDYDTRVWQLGEWNCSPYEFPIIKWQKIEEGEEVNGSDN